MAKTVQLNTSGTVRSISDADGICTTFEYTDATGFVGAPTKIRRSNVDDYCGSVPIYTATGEVEIRTYIAGEVDRLASVERRLNNVVQLCWLHIR